MHVLDDTVLSALEDRDGRYEGKFRGDCVQNGLAAHNMARFEKVECSCPCEFYSIGQSSDAVVQRNHRSWRDVSDFLYPLHFHVRTARSAQILTEA